MGKLRTCAAAAALLGPLVSAQAVAVSAQPRQEPRHVAVKKEGWLIPGRDYFRKLSRVAVKDVEGVAVTHKILDAPFEVIVGGGGLRVNPYARRRSGVILHSVREVSTYEANGRVFAYGIKLVPVVFTRGRNYWEKSYLGAMHVMFYIDDDGDGVFESRYAGWPLRELPERLRRNVQ